jgi:hypothetical protein
VFSVFYKNKVLEINKRGYEKKYPVLRLAGYLQNM